MLRAFVDLASKGVSGVAGNDCDQYRSNCKKHNADVSDGDSFHIAFSLAPTRSRHPRESDGDSFHIVFSLAPTHSRHSRESGNPLALKSTWIPAFAGMTILGMQAARTFVMLNK
jgi:hypothetical protein